MKRRNDRFCSRCGSTLDPRTGKCPQCEEAIRHSPDGKSTKRKKRSKIVTLSAIGILLLITLTVYLVFFLKNKVLDSVDKVLGQRLAGETISYENGDFLYIPMEDEIVYDDTEKVVYYDNLLLVYMLDEVDDKRAEEIAQTVNGEVIGEISGSINVLQLRVEDTELRDIMSKAELIMSFDDVLYASYEYPIQPDYEAIDNNPWCDWGEIEADRGNEANPAGNDWWAEAIGAYTAWENSDDLESIRVGVIDNGFDQNHTDLNGKLYFLNQYPQNEEAYHGTHVTGVIAANNNDIGIRGIVDNAEILCASFYKRLSDGRYENLLSSGEYIEIIKRLIESDVRVINNSWGQHVYSIERYERELQSNSGNIVLAPAAYASRIEQAYADYRELIKEQVTRTAIDCILIISSMHLNDEKDFIIVQAAGNGYDNGGEGYDARWAGFFCGIDSECYEELEKETQGKLLNIGMDYNIIDEHILIVGAVENTTDEAGNYQMTSFSNYGPTIDICAPGKDVYSLVSKNRYSCLDGTSMAAPQVTGSVALIWATDMNQSVSQVRERLLHTTDVMTYGVGGGAGTYYPMLNVGLSITTNIEVEGDEEKEEVQTEEIVPLVTDVYSNSYSYTKKQYNFVEEKYEDMQFVANYFIPQINIAGDETKQLNNEIYDSLNSIIQTSVSHIEKEEFDEPTFYKNVTYNWGISENILSVLIKKERLTEYGGKSYDVYTISTVDGTLADRKVILESVGMAEEDFYTRCNTVLQYLYIDTYGQIMDSSSDFFQQQLQKTVSKENIDVSSVYVNETGELCMIISMYNLAGSSTTVYNINLNTYEIIP